MAATALTVAVPAPAAQADPIGFVQCAAYSLPPYYVQLVNSMLGNGPPPRPVTWCPPLFP
ncbi:MAG TPA: hypothetical protein VFZ89_16250 [Solirubrobacteraceae bacterium]